MCNCRQKFLYTPRQFVAFTTPIFMKLILTKYSFTDISHTKFDPNQKKYVQSMVKI